MALLRRVIDSVKHAKRSVLARSVPVDRLLLGADVARDARAYAEATGDWLRTSTRLLDGPHVALLKSADAAGGDLPDHALRASPYVQQGLRCIKAFGRYHEAVDEAGMLALARELIAVHRGGKPTVAPDAPGRSRPGSLPVVRKIAGSDCFQIHDGHHRLALLAARGETAVRVYVKSRPAHTSAQTLILDVESTRHRPALYQPVELPEMGRGWPLRRKCTDRLEMMRDFLKQRNILGAGPQLTSLDVACNYGWFVSQFRAMGIRAHGVEIDPAALRIGKLLYANTDADVTCGDAVEFLRKAPVPFDIVTCFSLAHHFVLGRGPCSAEELLRLLDKATARVMFFDTGQGHERWFREKLAGWDEAKVQSWLREYSTFREIVKLGVDTDNVGVTAENYRRTLFALVR